jgi:hypothetical protein
MGRRHQAAATSAGAWCLNADAATLADLGAKTQAWHRFVRGLALGYPVAIRSFLLLNQETGERWAELPGLDHWQRVLIMARISADKLDKIMSLFNFFLHKRRVLVQQYTVRASQLAAAMEWESSLGSHSTALGERVLGPALSNSDALRELRRGLAREHLLEASAKMGLFAILSPLDIARLMVGA